jgi:hypothetical protein
MTAACGARPRASLCSTQFATELAAAFGGLFDELLRAVIDGGAAASADGASALQLAKLLPVVERVSDTGRSVVHFAWTRGYSAQRGNLCMVGF